MSVTSQRACDRCGTAMTHPRGILTVNYHHPSTLDICESCEAEFTIWLGKHPLWGTSLADIIAGRASGAGYPSEQRIQALRAETNEETTT